MFFCFFVRGLKVSEDVKIENNPFPTSEDWCDIIYEISLRTFDLFEVSKGEIQGTLEKKR